MGAARRVPGLYAPLAMADTEELPRAGWRVYFDDLSRALQLLGVSHREPRIQTWHAPQPLRKWRADNVASHDRSRSLG